MHHQRSDTNWPQENELFSQLAATKTAGQEGNYQQIRNSLVEKHLGLVRKVVQQDYYQGEESGMTEEDLIQEGSIGLMKAIDRFDPSRGKFSTYAWIWIRQAISRALENQARGIRIPAEWVRQEQRYKKQDGSFDSSQSEVREQQFFHVPRLFYSLDSCKDDNAEPEITTYASDWPGPEEQAIQNERKEQVGFLVNRALYQKLTHRETEVIQRRFGLSGQIENSRTEVGKQLGLSRQRIAQVEGNALMKLRQVANGQLADF